jgi:hypothetical protein
VKAARTYTSLTGRGLMGNTLTWMQELVSEFGDEEVSEALEEHALDVAADKLMGRVRDVLARRRLVEARGTPVQLDRTRLLAWVRGTATPLFPVIYDLPRLGLTAEEVREVETWALGKHGLRVLPSQPMPASAEPPADAAAESWVEPGGAA